jgi:hypothetical protein
LDDADISAVRKPTHGRSLSVYAEARALLSLC